MPDSVPTNSPIVAAYRQRTPGSAALAERAAALFPSGVTHDSRRILPYGIYVERAEGPWKWDVDGNAYVDYYGGHGALLLGHGRPEVVAAVQAQMAGGTQYGACHELEVRWGALVQTLIPSAQKVRFTSSGTEANLMALRLARAFTRRHKVIRFVGHFHGWSDHMAFGVDSHFDGTPTPGVLEGVAAKTVLAAANDAEAVRRILETDDDIAAVIIEATGAGGGVEPVGGAFLAELRALTQAHGVVLIFDEVVTGFRVSRGGAQAHYGVTPDLTSLAKILAGGLPGGAVAGRADILELLDFDAAEAKAFEKIGHQGTYNANPLSAAAGVAALEIVRDGDACERANEAAADLCDRLNAVLAEEGLPWACHANFSNFFMFLNPQGLDIGPHDFDAAAHDYHTLKVKSPLANSLRLGLLVHGVDMSGKIGGSVSATHGAAELAHTADALRGAIAMLREAGLLPEARARSVA